MRIVALFGLAVGKFLLVILLILLLLLALVLFVPFRYRAEGTKHGSDLSGSARVTWLLHALTVELKFIMENGQRTADLDFRIFGISPKKMQEGRQAAAREKRKKERKAKIEDIRKHDPERFEEMRNEALLRSQARKAEAEAQKRREEQLREEERKEEQLVSVKDTKQTLVRSHRSRRLKRLLFSALHALRRWAETLIDQAVLLFYFPAYLTEKAGRLFSDISRKINRMISFICFLADPRTQMAAGHALKEAGIILKHILPRKLKGNLTYGTGDPALTGELMGGIAVFLARYGRDLRIYPDFENKRIEGTAGLSGRISLICPAAAAVRLIIDKKVRFAFRAWKDLKEDA
jgi:hypothetical protein